MIEAWKVPILTSALSFLYDVGRFLMNDIAERRQQKTDDNSASTDFLDGSDGIVDKQQALSTKVEEKMVQQKEKEIEHLLKLADTYVTNYRLAREKYAKWGEAMVPPIILHELQEAENNLEQIMTRLSSEVEGVMGQKLYLHSE